ncbi:dnaJ homolog subfamily C member 11-like [Styela clava]
MSAQGLEDIVDNEDFYSLLNASRQASQDELRTSYRRLCMQYHPDKHNEVYRREATEVFNRVQYAYDVLSDPNKRYIYDMYGRKGLEAEWQIVERKKTPQEIQEEYERLQRRKEMQRLEERTHPTGQFVMNVNATSLFDGQPYEEDEFYDSVAVPEITKLSLSQSVEAPLTVSHTATISGNLESKNGHGRGDLSVALRQVISPLMWGELTVGASDGKFMTFGLRGYRTISQGLFATVHIPASVIFHDSNIAISLPGVTSIVGHKISENLFGSIELTKGHVDRLSTSIIYEKKAIQIFGKLQLGVPNSFAMVRLTYKLPSDKAKTKVSLKVGTIGILIEYGAEHQVSEFSTVGATVSVGVPLGVSLKLRLNRASQTYFMPILLSDEVNPVAIFYATALPATFYFALQKLVVQPYLKRKKKEEEESEEKTHSEETAQKKAEAERQVRLMQESVERKIELETQKSGLLITDAWYGKLVNNAAEQSSSHRVIDVKVPLQNQVESSSLQLPEGISKSGLPGFYDPCPGSEKSLKILYKFRNKKHEVLIADKDRLRMPLRSHILEGDNGV